MGLDDEQGGGEMELRKERAGRSHLAQLGDRSWSLQKALPGSFCGLQEEKGFACLQKHKPVDPSFLFVSE